MLIGIVADLTPAEAKASYELRCARRQLGAASHTRELGAVNPNLQEDGSVATATSLDTPVTAFTPVSTTNMIFVTVYLTQNLSIVLLERIVLVAQVVVCVPL